MYYRNVNLVQMIEISHFASEFCEKNDSLSMLTEHHRDQ